MKKMNLAFLAVVLGLTVAQGTLFAEMVQGQVTAINKQNQSITISEQDMSGAGASKSKELAVAPDAKFSGIQSLDQLEVGDQIQAEVEKKMFGKEEVKQLTSTKAAVANQSAQASQLSQQAGSASGALSAGAAPPGNTTPANESGFAGTSNANSSSTSGSNAAGSSSNY